jgi:hypothetical protein
MHWLDEDLSFLVLMELPNCFGGKNLPLSLKIQTWGEQKNQKFSPNGPLIIKYKISVIQCMKCNVPKRC